MENNTLKVVKVYNTMTKKVDPIEPLEPGHITLYCCGPTVYNYQHVGNLRTYIFEDLLARTLRYAGYKVTHCMNITDVGHLVSDADEGEDKMLVASKREGKKSAEIANFYTKIFFDHCNWLNIIRPDIVCKATEHIEQMIALIERLVEKDIAYVSGGNVYFDVARFPEYGKLAQLDLEKLKAGARIDVDDHKRNPQDFALWFTKSKFENQELQWESPWGEGYPGWHIECSAMAMHHLGESFDIHCGGIDHIPVHHTNEIAQSEAATGKTFATIWMHGGFLVADKSKMSKSTGEFLTLDLVKDKGFDPMSYRLLCLSGTYRHELAWSWEALTNANNTLIKLRNSVMNIKDAASKEKNYPLSNEALEYVKQFEDAIFTDLAMPRAISVLHKVVASSLVAKEKLFLLEQFDEVFGLGIKDWEAKEINIPTEVQLLAEKREAAREAKNWTEADTLRDKITELGYTIEDSKDGTIIKPL